MIDTIAYRRKKKRKEKKKLRLWRNFHCCVRLLHYVFAIISEEIVKQGSLSFDSDKF